MSSFLSGKDLEDKLTDIIWNANHYVILISPFIKLDNHVRSIFDKLKSTHEVYLVMLFGKNEGYKQKSFKAEDFEYFKEFKNIAILYNKDLHAKHYCNEKEALITSLNLYDYSMVNNIEYGVHFTKSLLNPTDKLFEETANFTDVLIFEKSEVVFLKKPQYKKKLLGLTKTYQDSKILHDVSEEFFKDQKYDVKYLNQFNIEEFSDMDKMYEVKPQREASVPQNKEAENGSINNSSSKEQFQFGNQNGNEAFIHGFCIRTGEKIEFDPERPFSYSAFQTWSQFGNEDYPECFCHFSGEPSHGETTYARPILRKNWREAKKYIS